MLERVKAKYPNLPMMLCSGGGARSDYQALKYFTEFWPSDNTDPIERLFHSMGIFAGISRENDVCTCHFLEQEYQYQVSYRCSHDV